MLRLPHKPSIILNGQSFWTIGNNGFNRFQRVFVWSLDGVYRLPPLRCIFFFVKIGNLGTATDSRRHEEERSLKGELKMNIHVPARCWCPHFVEGFIHSCNWLLSKMRGLVTYTGFAIKTSIQQQQKHYNLQNLRTYSELFHKTHHPLTNITTNYPLILSPHCLIHSCLTG